MAFETSSYASSCLQSNDAPKELLELLGILNKNQQRQQEQRQRQLPQHCHSHGDNLGEGQQQQQQRRQQTQQKEHVELSQIELIYRAEGNANLVLALPQFKKVLRLPKMQKQQQQQVELEQQPHFQGTQYHQNYPHQNKQEQQQQQQERQQQQQHALKQQEPTNMTLTTTGQQHNRNAVGILTMDHYVAYIGIIRCLLGNEFVFEADIVAVPNPNDRDWINEHIRPSRPVNRLDKEFGGHYGLLLPDATRLPAEFDVLFSNLQQTKSTAGQTQPATNPKTICCCCCCTAIGDDGSGCVGGGCGNDNIFVEDTYAIEIKPKQGWLLPNDVNNLFDIKPTTAPTATPTAATVVSTSSEVALKTSTDKECFTATQNKPSATTTTTATAKFTSSSSSAGAATATAAATLRDDKISHSLHGQADIRCRYCSLQFLKLEQQKITERSNYCPIDLFSSVPERMWNALHALFICPQNNLRIFKNGIVVFDDQLSRLSKIEDLFPSDKLQLIKHLLVASLLRDYSQREEDDVATAPNEDGDIIYDAEATKVTNEAKEAKQVEGADCGDAAGEPHASVTPCKKQRANICIATPTSTRPATVKAKAEPEVTKVNTTFTASTTTTTISAITGTGTTAPVQHYSPCGSGHCCRPSCGSDVSVGQMNIPEMLSLPKNCVLQKILHLQLLAKQNLPYMLEHKYSEIKEKSYHSLRKLLKKFAQHGNKLEISQLAPEEQYLLAATALDCSVMITFRQVPCGGDKSSPKSPHVMCLGCQYFLTKITLLDLDPKPDSHFAKYCKQTKEIAEVLHR